MDNLLSIKAYASREAVPIMQDEGCDFICSYIKEHSCKNILEIGTAIGYSSIRFASLAEDIKVTTIELDIDRHLKAVENFKAAGLSDRISAIHADALTCPLEGSFDLIFIDAAKAQYIKFFEKYKANLAPEGVIISHRHATHRLPLPHLAPLRVFLSPLFLLPSFLCHRPSASRSPPSTFTGQGAFKMSLPVVNTPWT